MIPEIKTLLEKKLVGIYTTTSLINNKTRELWQHFMPRRMEIQNRVSSDLISLQVFDTAYSFAQFSPGATFEKWALAEVSDFSFIPPQMEAFTLPGGLYAVFTHKGPVSEGPKTFQYIFGTWIPNSEYDLDLRPHFEILGAKYKNEAPDSEEEIWIPIKPKS